MKRRVRTSMNWILVDNFIPLPETDIRASNHSVEPEWKPFYRIGACMRSESNSSGSISLCIVFSVNHEIPGDDHRQILDRVQTLIDEGTILDNLPSQPRKSATLHLNYGFKTLRNEPLCEAALRIVRRIYEKFGVANVSEPLSNFKLEQTPMVKFQGKWMNFENYLKKLIAAA